MISRQRLSEKRSKPRTFTVALKRQVKSLLKKDFSPEQISGRLKLSGIAISHETIYQWIWKNKAFKGKLYLYLKRRGRSYKRRGAIYQTRGAIKDRVDIDLRADIVRERRRVGDWEVDCIVGKAHKGAIVSMVDRKTRLVKNFSAGKTSLGIDTVFRTYKLVKKRMGNSVLLFNTEFFISAFDVHIDSLQVFPVSIFFFQHPTQHPT